MAPCSQSQIDICGSNDAGGKWQAGSDRLANDFRICARSHSEGCTRLHDSRYLSGLNDGSGPRNHLRDLTADGLQALECSGCAKCQFHGRDTTGQQRPRQMHGLPRLFDDQHRNDCGGVQVSQHGLREQ